MAGSGKYGDWEKLERLFSGVGQKFKTEVKAATDTNGRLIEETVVGHFEKQDLGWAPLAPATQARKAHEFQAGKLRKLSKKTLATRLAAKGIAFSPKESRLTLAERLAFRRHLVRQMAKLGKKRLIAQLQKEKVAHSPKESNQTLARRLSQAGVQILIETATLMSNIRYQKKGWNEGFVGVLRNTTAKGGDLVNIAAVHEFGSPKRNIPARPFFRPSEKECAGPVAKNYEEAVERAFKK
jgi:phage gpG-like protein